jgi:effector-binding domain-containing protein
MIIPSKNFWTVFKNTPGALSCAEAMSIIQIAALAPIGEYMELGSNRGKSSLAATQSLKEGIFYLVEPEFKDDEWHKEVVNKVFRNSVEHISPRGIADYSTNVIDKYGKYSYVFWDSGEHGGEILWKETEMLEDALVSGGILCSHDIGNQFTQQTEAMNKLVATGKYEWVSINWNEIFEYVKEHNLEEGNVSWHQYPELPHPPNFVGALRRK